jgi:hypothetical protein
MCRSSRFRRFLSPPPVCAYDVAPVALAPDLSWLRVTSPVTSIRNSVKTQRSLWFVEPVGASTPRVYWTSRVQPPTSVSAPGPSATWSSAGHCRGSHCRAYADCCSIAATSTVSSRGAASQQRSSRKHRQRNSFFPFERGPMPQKFRVASGGGSFLAIAPGNQNTLNQRGRIN